MSLPELLARLPFVSVSGEGSISLKGQSNFKVTIDGKPSNLMTSSPDFLKSFPADLIERIEIMTSAGAKYEGEGVAGIINIITKRKLKGYNGTSALNINTIGQINPNTGFNIKTGRLGISAFGFVAKNLGYDVEGSTLFKDKSTLNTRRILETGRNNGYQTGFNLELAYDIDSTRILSIYGRLSGAGGHNMREGVITSFNATNSSPASGNRNMIDDIRIPGYETGIDFIKKGPNKKETTISLNLLKSGNETTTQSSDIGAMSLAREIVNSSKTTNTQSILGLDKLITIDNSQLEFGSKIILRDVKSRYSSQVGLPPHFQLRTDPSNSDLLRYHQNLYAVYISWRLQGGEKWKLRLGLRAEKTVVNAKFQSTSEKIRQNYTSLLPSVSLTRPIRKSNFNLSYQRKIARPGVSYLNPYTDNRDSAFVSYGNPGLLPETVDLIDVLISKFTSQLSFSSGVSLLYTRGTIQRVFSYEPTSAKTQQTFVNSGISQQMGLHNFIAYNSTTGWFFSSNLGLYFIAVKDKQRLSTSTKGTQFSVNGNFRYDIKKKFYYYSNVNYSSPSIQLSGRSADYLFYNLGAGWRLANSKLVLTITAINFLQQSRKFSSSYQTDRFSQQIDLHRPFRSISLGIRYSFGRLKETVTRKKNLFVDDVKEIPTNKL